MKEKLMKRQGFAAMEIVLVGVLIIVIAAVGYRAYQARRVPVFVDSVTPLPPQFLTISSTKVRIPLNAKTRGLKLGKLMPSGYDEKDQSVAIIAPQLDATWTCAADETQKFKATIGSISATKQLKRSGPGDPLSWTKIGDYTYGFEPGGSNCTTSPAYKTLVDEFKIQFDKISSY